MSDKETVKMEVVVHKVDIPLAAGESIHDFTRSLSDAGVEFVKGKLNIGKSGGAWMAEAFSTAAIFSTYKDGGPNQYYAAAYKRDKAGNFEFGTLMEVQRKTVFTPKTDTMALTKSKDVEVVIKAEGTWDHVNKPFPNEHAARQTDPKQYDQFRRGRPTGFPAGVDVIWGIKLKPKRTTEIQAIRFDAAKFTPVQAKAWLNEHDMKTGLVAAVKPTKTKKSLATFGGWEQTEKDFWNGVL
jgi:hypothetical protein